MLHLYFSTKKALISLKSILICSSFGPLWSFFLSHSLWVSSILLQLLGNQSSPTWPLCYTLHWRKKERKRCKKSMRWIVWTVPSSGPRIGINQTNCIDTFNDGLFCTVHCFLFNRPFSTWICYISESFVCPKLVWPSLSFEEHQSFFLLQLT